MNGQVIGPAGVYSTAGPARVCLEHTSVDIQEGEIAYLDYLGIHSGSVRVVGHRGTFLVSEGDAWAVPKGRSRLVPESGGRKIARHIKRGKLRYLIYGRVQPLDSERPLVWVEGNALGGGREAATLTRIVTSEGDPAGCDKRFRYGWDGFVAPRNK